MPSLAPQPLPPTNSGALQETRAALVIAHPGHELCIYGWVARLRPFVFVLTDGSGRSQKPRIQHSTSILDRLGATRGSVYGRFNDATIYRALLNHDFNLFTQIAAEIAETIARDELTCVVGDASEGYSPTHDACRMIVNAAVAMARERTVRDITNFEFPVVGQPNGRVTTGAAPPSCFKLNDQTFEEKLAAARAYPALQEDVDDLLRKYSEDAFRTEYLYPTADGYEQSVNQNFPYYEELGEQRVRDGYYERAIRYHEHLLPLARSLPGANGRQSR